MSNPSPRDLADTAAEAIRSLNHATLSTKGELTYPSDAYEVVAALTQLTQRLPQTFDQLAHFLGTLPKTGTVTADYGTPDEHLAQSRSALASAALIARTLADHLARAQDALAPLTYDDATDEEPCGEGMCICYCTGFLHPCGCDCPHDEDCDCPDCMPDA
ncbi:hypothetical protein G3I60_36440 [Streptomyces sp. SID13666]|uniref:hypothetical protein n=1 Tax=Streptomyces sp. SID13666 TaxID=2706054 RepID=UPI0013C1153E|nr:hypothetical protein [Streptomyces sp. SID13666]NEA59507.1 hypothetical protein [Streptomyces sp. SID13666]